MRAETGSSRPSVWDDRLHIDKAGQNRRSDGWKSDVYCQPRQGVKEELRNMVNEADGKLDVLEYHMRRYCDTDDVGAFGKEQPSDD